jgi:deazaflavin-dependent oxidoreductase (nitroreductase family)
MPADAVLKAMNAAHHLLLRASGGKLGWSAFGMPVIELTTTGARTGTPRTVMLTSPYHDESGYVIVASRGGDDRHPAWYHNLVAHPQVKAAIAGGPAREMTATVLGPEERERVWAEIARRYRNYRGYQASTSRVIPLVRLS